MQTQNDEPRFRKHLEIPPGWIRGRITMRLFGPHNYEFLLEVSLFNMEEETLRLIDSYFHWEIEYIGDQVRHRFAAFRHGFCLAVGPWSNTHSEAHAGYAFEDVLAQGDLHDAENGDYDFNSLVSETLVKTVLAVSKTALLDYTEELCFQQILAQIFGEDAEKYPSFPETVVVSPIDDVDDYLYEGRDLYEDYNGSDEGNGREDPHSFESLMTIPTTKGAYDCTRSRLDLTGPRNQEEA